MGRRERGCFPALVECTLIPYSAEAFGQCVDQGSPQQSEADESLKGMFE